jgi:hypothetical protein
MEAKATLIKRRLKIILNRVRHSSGNVAQQTMEMVAGQATLQLADVASFTSDLAAR